MDIGNLFGLKFLLTAIGGFLIYIASSLEPSVAVWVISVGGSLITSVMGNDRSLREIVVHLIIGLGFGVFGSQIIHDVFSYIPQVAAAFFTALFGVEISGYFSRNLREGSLSELIVGIVQALIPKFIKKDK